MLRRLLAGMLLSRLAIALSSKLSGAFPTTRFSISARNAGVKWDMTSHLAFLTNSFPNLLMATFADALLHLCVTTFSCEFSLAT